MVTKRKVLQPGDVLELQTEGRFAYLQYMGKHPGYGDGILVSPGLREASASVTDALFTQAYFTFYPARASVAQGLLEIVGHLPVRPIPQLFRRRGAIQNGRVMTWIIENGGKDEVKKELSDDDLLLPIAAIWNHEFLVKRIAKNWDPKEEGKIGKNEESPILEDAIKTSTTEVHVVPGTAAASPPEVLQSLQHYIYAPTQNAAASIATELQRQGFRTEEQISADGTNWLVLAFHEVDPTTEAMSSVRTSMEVLAKRFSGEYDGWEAEIRREYVKR